MAEQKAHSKETLLIKRFAVFLFPVLFKNKLKASSSLPPGISPLCLYPLSSRDEIIMIIIITILLKKFSLLCVARDELWAAGLIFICEFDNENHSRIKYYPNIWGLSTHNLAIWGQ
jgi:hypothetical protein